MTDSTRIGNALRAPQTAPTPAAERKKETALRPDGATGSSFADMLRARQGVAGSPAAPTDGADALRFSAHAQTRLQSRHIDLQAGHLKRLQSAVGRAANKGSKDALVLMDDMAFVVSVTNRTVVTVVDKDNLKQNVFTNIDSAVIA